MIEIKITDKSGVTLKTAGKYCPEDIAVTIDENLLAVPEEVIKEYETQVLGGAY
jgi:hypothetical protein